MGNENTQKSWSERVAGLGVDVLIDNGLIKKEDCDRATKIVAEEILVRLSLGDCPPSKQPH